jgi:hypothetical protein
MPSRNTGQHAPPPARLAHRPLWRLPCPYPALGHSVTSIRERQMQ